MLAKLPYFTLLFFITFIQFSPAETAKPNIVWICIEDASAHIGCYGETAIQTPIMDQLAKDGIKFERAFVTAPVCSASRSAMVTGMYQMTTGFHLHRSQRTSGKGSGNKAHYDSYQVPKEIVTVPELFKQAGYYTSNKTKTDYNFIRKGLYDSKKDWQGRQKGQPFFAQFQLNGGKYRGNSKGVDQSKIVLPPYYADTEIIRKDWVAYLGSWVKTDTEVAKIINNLKSAGELENTYIFLWTDHGVSHIRGKQFLYDEGIKVPLIIRMPKKNMANTIRQDQVTHIDIPVSSLALAGIEVPAYMQGKNIFAETYNEQHKVFSGRDRCDEVVDIIRSIRTKKYKYIRNFLPDVSHMQRSQYKDAKKIVSHSRELFHQGKLNELQARPFLASRPLEELYDLEKDPHETQNLALDEQYIQTVKDFRQELTEWMIANNDLGLIPEPILEDLGKKYGSKYAILKQHEHKNLVSSIITIIEAGESNDNDAISKGLNSTEACIRYWAAKAVGNKKIPALKYQLAVMLKDKNASVRIASAEALGKLGDLKAAMPILTSATEHQNLLVGMYALRAIEALGIQTKSAAQEVIKKALKSKYEFSKRIAKRLNSEWKL